MANRIRILFCPVGAPAEEREVPNHLPAFQALVGGYIEHVSLARRGLAVICNEEGLLLGLPFNRMVPSRGLVNIHGPFFVTAIYGEDFVSLTDEQLAWAQHYVGKLGCCDG